MGFPTSMALPNGMTLPRTKLIIRRFPVAFQAFFAIALIALVLVLPESPRWLVRKNRMEEATDVLQRLAGKNVDADDTRVLKLREEIVEAVREESAEGANFSYRELFKGGKTQNLRRILLCWAVQCFQQLSGINLITYYAPGTAYSCHI